MAVHLYKANQPVKLGLGQIALTPAQAAMRSWLLPYKGKLAELPDRSWYQIPDRDPEQFAKGDEFGWNGDIESEYVKKLTIHKAAKKKPGPKPKHAE